MFNDDDGSKPDRIIVPGDRVLSRGQGCWNCIHGQRAKEWWSRRRQEDLGKALQIAIESPDGETDIQVTNIRRMVDAVDHAVAKGAMLRCTKGKTANGQPVGDLVTHNYLCDRWTAAPGASIARGGAKADELPEEILDKLDGTPERKPIPSVRSDDDDDDN